MAPDGKQELNSQKQYSTVLYNSGYHRDLLTTEASCYQAGPLIQNHIKETLYLQLVGVRREGQGFG